MRQRWAHYCFVFHVPVILQMRIYALYSRSRRVLLVMGTAFVLEIMTMAAILIIENITSGTNNEPTPGLKICTNEGTSGTFYVFWLPILGFECLLCSLAIWAGIKLSRNGARSLPRKVQLLDVLIKGNVGYFLVVFLVAVMTAAMWGMLSPEWLEVPEGFPHAVAVIAGCRLILHIRDVTTPVLDDVTLQESRLAFEYPMERYTQKSTLTTEGP
ncbi:hypothetical protein ID866_5733 [Astraeus odoratus]|nr:hypothetical protein ID866_5733 [Astraeus odoratus]